MALKEAEIIELLKSGDLTIGQAIEYVRPLVPQTSAKGRKSDQLSAIDTLFNSLSSGEDATGLTLESKWSELDDDDILRNLGGDNPSQSNRLRNIQVIENKLRSPIKKAKVSDAYPLLVGGKDSDSRAKDLGLQTQKRGKQPTKGLVPTEDADRIYFGSGDVENPGGAIGKIKDPNVRGFLIYQRYTGARIESTIDPEFGLKADQVKFRKVGGELIADVQSITFGKKTRPAMQFSGSFAEFLKAEVDRAKLSGQTNVFETTKARTDAAWNTHFRPIFEAEFSGDLPISTRSGKPFAPPTYPRKLVSTILEEEVGVPKSLVKDFMGHTDGSTLAQSYTGGRGSKVEVGSLVDNMVRDSARLAEVGDTNAFFIQNGVEIKNPTASHSPLPETFMWGQVGEDVTRPMPVSDEEIKAAQDANVARQQRIAAEERKLTLEAQMEEAQRLKDPQVREDLIAAEKAKKQIEEETKAIKKEAAAQVEAEQAKPKMGSEEKKGIAKKFMSLFGKAPIPGKKTVQAGLTLLGGYATTQDVEAAQQISEMEDRDAASQQAAELGLSMTPGAFIQMGAETLMPSFGEKLEEESQFSERGYTSEEEAASGFADIED